MTYWVAQPGPQAYAVVCPADLTLFGGSRGPGKTEAACGRNVIGMSSHGLNWHGMQIRRKYKDFAKIRSVWDRIKNAGAPIERVGGENQVNYIRGENGSIVKLQAMNHPDMADDEQGNEYTEIQFDDAGTLPYIGKLVNKLKATLRSSAGVPCRMFLTANPGGPGHGWLKETFITGAEPFVPRIDPRSGFSTVYIPAFLKDNYLLARNDPGYVNRMLSIDDPVLRRAWIDGDWDAFAGQALDFTSRHQIDPLPVPAWAQIVMTYDWGFSSPFSIGWWWLDGDRRFYRFAEWYGWNGVPDEGCRMADSDVALGIIQREKELGIYGRPILRLAGHDCFAKRADTKAGGQLPSTATTFAQHGIFLKAGNPARQSKIRQFRERLKLRVSTSGQLLELPMMMVYKTCTNFIRTIPYLAMEENTEDIDQGGQEDHAYDEAGLICNEFPVKTAAMHAESPSPLPHNEPVSASMETIGTERSVLDD